MGYKTLNKAILLLEDGTVFKGNAMGIQGNAYGEICYNTSMTGYQEVFTDPSYFGQLVVTTNAHIGNYGTKDVDSESNTIKISGLICKNFSHTASRFGNVETLMNYFKKQNVVAIKNVDTRALVGHIRNKGAMNGMITTDLDMQKVKEQLKKIPKMKGLDLASKVSTKMPYFYGNANAKYKISILDLGIKENILRSLAKRDCYMKVFPLSTTFEEMKSFEPDGYFLSNGPGDPGPLFHAQEIAKKILAINAPLFGICLGHQIIALANGIKIDKMHNGHRGINHPIKNVITGRGEITSQNHGFVIDKKSLAKNKNIEITHIHLNDNTVAGIRIKNKKCFSVQYHPEASPGPNDSSYLFDDFVKIFKYY